METESDQRNRRWEATAQRTFCQKDHDQSGFQEANESLSAFGSQCQFH